MPDPQGYAIEQERYRHNQALSFFGEFAMFILLWQLTDFEAGLVGRCPDCYLSAGRTAQVYGQGVREKCPECFGTTFEGGYRAKIVRPSLWDANEELETQRERGEVTLQDSSIQTTSDFRLMNGDFIFRGDGTRWRMQSLSTNHLRTGFLMPDRVDTPLGYNFGVVKREDESSVAYIIPPEDLSFLDVLNVREPQDWSAYEDINGYLMEPEPDEGGGWSSP